VKRDEHEPAQLVCPKCQHQIIVYLPLDDLPICPECKQARMVIEELLDEGKAY
jgi:Zn finger protein HypA/HybF involved in hydrogenase expression